MDSPTYVELPNHFIVPMISSSSSPAPSLYEEEDYAVLGFESRPHYGASLRRERVSKLSVNCFGLVLIIICLLGSMFLMLGVYGPKTVCLGPNSSMLVQTSAMFVENIMVKELALKPGLHVYGFSKSPPLDVFANWSESRVLNVSQKSHKGWPYYLNKGTTLNISYNVKPEGSAVQLVVNEGIQDISQWLLNHPAHRYTAWSCNIIQGSGMIELNISKSSSYYVSVANLKNKDIKVELKIDVRGVLYDTKLSSYKCTFNNGECIFDVMSLVGSSIVVTSPAPSMQAQGVSVGDEWHVMLSYQPRWVGYVIGIVMVICYMLVAINLWKSLQCCVGERLVPENDSTRRGLLANKDDDGSSMGSCNESFAEDDADLEIFMGNEGEASKSNRGLCVICCDAPRDCFFFPCGHCVACYQCGIKMEEADMGCPICRREMKVKRIYIA